MSANLFELESKSTSGANLVVRMSLESDRFVTELYAVVDHAIVPLLQSIEGTSAQIWPPNGPLQEVVRQSNPTGDFLAGVGRAGKSHWSAIISSPRPYESWIEFDFACRAKSEPAWTGSTYQSRLSSSPLAKPDRVEFELPGETGMLVCHALESTQLAQDSDGQICFTPVSDATSLPRTERWKYRFELA